MCKNYNFDTYGDGVDNEIYFMDKVCNKKVKKTKKKLWWFSTFQQPQKTCKP